MARGNLSIADVAAVMNLDKQTVRLMIQQGIVPWGRCWKRPGSHRYSYIISPKAFYEATGCKLGGYEGD